MKILVGCEWSGRVRDAFRRRGHDAYSCDIAGTRGEFPEFHIKGDVRELLDNRWDMAVFFPPCTYLATTGAGMDGHRARLQREAIAFVRELWEAPIEQIAIENPIGVLSTQFHKPDQYIQPYMFGEPWTKKTCLWLKNLPELVTTDWRRADAMPWVNSGRSHGFGNRNSKVRGITFKGIAEAMAEQWGIKDDAIPEEGQVLLPWRPKIYKTTDHSNTPLKTTKAPRKTQALSAYPGAHWRRNSPRLGDVQSLAIHNPSMSKLSELTGLASLFGCAKPSRKG